MTKYHKKKIFSLVVEQLVKIFCTTQTYTWRRRLYVQIKGMPIGPRATSAVSRVVMNFFDKKFFRSLRTLKIETELLIRYIDDIRFILRKLMMGTVVRNNALEIDEEQKAADEELEDPEVEVV